MLNRRHAFKLALAGCAAVVALATTVQAQEKTELSLALNYTLGAGHGGLVAAQQLGYFEEAGLEVKVVPWSSQTRSETLLATGNVDFAYIASTDDALINIAAERPITVLGTVVQHDPVLIGYKTGGDIVRPADLDGKTYGGFGSSKEPILLKALIVADGGEGTFSNVVLGTAAYEALYAGKVDAALFFSFSDAVNAAEKGYDISYFKYADYGVPDQYGTLLAANSAYLAEHPEVARTLMAALVRGYEYELAHPDATAQMLIEAGSTSDVAFLKKSIAAFNATLADSAGAIGPMDLGVWQARADFWVESGFLVDRDGAQIKTPLDVSGSVTNDYLPQ